MIVHVDVTWEGAWEVGDYMILHWEHGRVVTV